MYFVQVSTDTSKKRINSLTMELIEARNSLDSKSKVCKSKSKYLCVVIFHLQYDIMIWFITYSLCLVPGVECSAGEH